MYRRDTKEWLKHLDFIVLDLLIVPLSLLLAYILRHGFTMAYAKQIYFDVAAFLVLWDLILIFFTEPFRNIRKRGYYRELEALVQQTVLLELFAMVYLFARQESYDFSRLVMLYMGIVYLALSYVIRTIWKRVLNRFQNDGSRSLLIVTDRTNAQKVVRNIQNNNFGNFQLTGVILTDSEDGQTEVCGIPVVAGLADAKEYTQKHWVDEVLVSLPETLNVAQDFVDSFVEMGITVHQHLSWISSAPGRRQLVEKMGAYSVLTTSMNYATTKQAFLKRALDIVGGLVGCALCGLLCLFVAPAIYINSPGPIFFTQERIGKNGKRFKIYKFRSMYMDAEERKKELLAQNKMNGSLMFKLDFDPRIIGNRILPDGTQKTGIGQFIRSTSIDEFPQFFNVLKGDMSLVGTRPPLISEFDAYEQHHRARMSVKPGITGMWQISGRSEITDFEEVVRLDTQYINEWSIGLDIKILLQTVVTVLKRKGSM